MPATTNKPTPTLAIKLAAKGVWSQNEYRLAMLEFNRVMTGRCRCCGTRLSQGQKECQNCGAER